METVWLIIIAGISCAYLIWHCISAVRQQKSGGGCCCTSSCPDKNRCANSNQTRRKNIAGD